MKIHAKGANPREAGYNLVVLMVAVTVMNILIAASLPLWSRIIQHDKEEELIFRGLQYAEAIRVFRIRFQRAPVRIEELVEAKPRCIRQLWKDPMTEDGKWKILYEGVPQAPGTGDGKPKDPEEPQDKDPGDKDSDDSDDSGFLSTEKKNTVTIGPIEGVVSKSNKRSAMIWFGQERYDQWQFRWQLMAQAHQPKFGGVPGEGQPPVPQGESVRWLGRPWPKWLGLQSAPPLAQPNTRPEGDEGAFGLPKRRPPDPDDAPPS